MTMILQFLCFFLKKKLEAQLIIMILKLFLNTSIVIFKKKFKIFFNTIISNCGF